MNTKLLAVYEIKLSSTDKFCYSSAQSKYYQRGANVTAQHRKISPKRCKCYSTGQSKYYQRGTKVTAQDRVNITKEVQMLQHRTE